jgi:hypothetical protein
MSDTNPNEFTDREEFILSYYRDRELSGSRRLSGYDLMIGVASVICIIAAAVREEVALGFVGYVLVVGWLGYIVVEGGRWTRDFQNIFRKYDAQLKAMNEKTGSR